VPAASFSVTDKEFEDFVQWVKASPFKYESPLEKQMRELLKETQKDPLYANLTATLEKAKPEWDSSVAKEMNANKKVLRCWSVMAYAFSAINRIRNAQRRHSFTNFFRAAGERYMAWQPMVGCRPSLATERRRK
jgi:hypothetical protein